MGNGELVGGGKERQEEGRLLFYFVKVSDNQWPIRPFPPSLPTTTNLTPSLFCHSDSVSGRARGSRGLGKEKLLPLTLVLNGKDCCSHIQMFQGVKLGLLNSSNARKTDSCFLGAAAKKVMWFERRGGKKSLFFSLSSLRKISGA